MQKSIIPGFIKWLILALLIMMSVTPIFAESTEQNPESEILVTATFFDSDLREALKEVSLQTGIAIVCDENVKGVITMDLKNVPLEKALRMMVSGEGLMYRKMGDYYIVGLPDPKNPTFAMLCKTEIYYFQNITADSAKALLPMVYTNYVKVDAEKNMATVNAPESIIDEIMTDLKKMDGERVQVKIKAILTEVRTDALKELGSNLLDFQNERGSRERHVNLDTLTGTWTLEGRGSFGYLQAVLSAMAQDKKATIEADPELIVAEGKTGQLFVGDKETLILRAEEDSTSFSTDTQTVEAGILLKVMPKVFSDHVELTVTQQMSAIEEKKDDSILVKTREFSSVINVNPSQTVMVAGMTEKRVKSDESGTPILRKIPLIRFFFGHKKQEKSDCQLVLFITAEVVK